MVSLLSFVVAFIVTTPLLFLLFLYIVFRRWTGSNRNAWIGAVQLSAPVFILSVSLLLNVIFGSMFVGWIIVLLLVLLAIAGIIQYKTRQEMRPGRILKGFLRLGFLVFLVLHLLLFCYGLVVRIVL